MADPSARSRFERSIPIGRMGYRVDIADVCLYTVTRGAELLTGTTIIADGGSWLVSSNDVDRVRNFKAML